MSSFLLYIIPILIGYQLIRYQLHKLFLYRSKAKLENLQNRLQELILSGKVNIHSPNYIFIEKLLSLVIIKLEDFTIIGLLFISRVKKDEIDQEETKSYMIDLLHNPELIIIYKDFSNEIKKYFSRRFASDLFIILFPILIIRRLSLTFFNWAFRRVLIFKTEFIKIISFQLMGPFSVETNTN